MANSTPIPPVITNAISVPMPLSAKVSIAQTTSGGASIAPIEVPILNRPPAIPRSFVGNHSALALIPAGIADASVSPIRPRRNARLIQPPASACAMLISDHNKAKIKKPIFSPMTSIK
ncbi:Uncharacterised protein [Salmonella enterica subsp. enterica serovar Bovismorbificans]|uniref:Uncharacterized protein n=1 Tax=Salmonella enterica subsp. enterica serovar Bovismorbificans TaxID=58097 RepID=A0A655E172_SALET|nr:Uncharacterised protein [Salmonella enterica subsp. enterica serovar Bovismorbificans]CNU07403.1 Uncharacterised protein [Salmonella enterica subsp. enterica serovar Bovismorbificans]CNU23250.1 Uncharacterised protein [Salmonella enterica subsp. enterica serovar Bovismorbificans]CNU26007.1 Uncharacterised protein [Salmonella enterica subsp. enterica serovar Bovismorbificans]CNU98453.1 Uncharacterised protein [Salmonella enterica subsp. enterica serovar Bovismorbificans]